MVTNRLPPEDIQAAEEMNDQMQARLAKKKELDEAGIDPFGRSFEVTHRATDIIDNFDQLEGQHVRVAGRIMALRGHGKVGFLDLQDISGRIQLYVKADLVGERDYFVYQHLDLGDVIGVSGEIFRTKRGEISVKVEELTLLAKALRPLPDKWHGLQDVEIRYRHRYLDLVVNPKVKDTFIARTKIISSIRNFLSSRGFLEVETPVLHSIAGGANARPFITHHNALDMDLYLRIAPELYLKRLIVGGLERVFELGKNFRNEGISTKHNPEYTMVEVYQAYADYHEMMSLTEELISYVAQTVKGSTKFEFQGQLIDVTPPWPRLPMLDAIEQYAGVDLSGDLTTVQIEEYRKQLKLGDEVRTKAQLINEAFDRYVEPRLIEPVFIVDYPVEISPLAKRKADDPTMTDRFEPYIVGWEIANGFSELNDPLDQRQRFLQQMEQRQAGDDEAHMMDEDYVVALEHGMPPTAGLGIGIDRLVMLLTDSPSIRDVLFFPLMRHRK